MAGKTMIDRDEAIVRAKNIATEHGWIWVDPAEAILRRSWFGRGGRWEIVSNAMALGAKVRVVLDAKSGQILERGYIPR